MGRSYENTIRCITQDPYLGSPTSFKRLPTLPNPSVTSPISSTSDSSSEPLTMLGFNFRPHLPNPPPPPPRTHYMVTCAQDDTLKPKLFPSNQAPSTYCPPL